MPETPAKITTRLLKAKGACPEQVKLFKKLYPGGFTITRAGLHEACTAGLDIQWAAQMFLSEPLRAAYNAQVEPLWAAYNAQVEPLWAAYNAQVADVLADVLGLGKEDHMLI